MARPAQRERPDESGGLRRLRGLASGEMGHKLLHERARLAIVSALAVDESLGFPELRDLLGLTDGNLSVHARRLEEAGLVAVKKSFEGRTPRTEFRLTARGRRALQRYLEHMEAVIRTVREG